jgi:hypothetical protein
MAPIKAYFLLDAQPANRRGYKFKLRTAKKNITEYSCEMGAVPRGAKDHRKSTKKIADMGEATNIRKFLLVGTNLSFTNSFTASANGCSRPTSATLLGPLRLCLSPKILRSSSVKKATFTNTGMIIVRYVNSVKKIIPGNHLCSFNATLFLSYKNSYKYP